MANIPTDTGKSDPEEHINTTATQSARDTDMLATGRVVGLAITITIR
jgi:hypothetical protein